MENCQRAAEVCAAQTGHSVVTPELVLLLIGAVLALVVWLANGVAPE
jgi:hypothetical protein